MPLSVNPGKRYPTGESYRVVTNTGRATIHVCDCCQDRRVFATLADCERHEDAHSYRYGYAE